MREMRYYTLPVLWKFSRSVDMRVPYGTGFEDSRPSKFLLLVIFVFARAASADL
jgi:hypothetical protein